MCVGNAANQWVQQAYGKVHLGKWWHSLLCGAEDGYYHNKPAYRGQIAFLPGRRTAQGAPVQRSMQVHNSPLRGMSVLLIGSTP